jgi:hypothetical protein
MPKSDRTPAEWYEDFVGGKKYGTVNGARKAVSGMLWPEEIKDAARRMITARMEKKTRMSKEDTALFEAERPMKEIIAMAARISVPEEPEEKASEEKVRKKPGRKPGSKNVPKPESTVPHVTREPVGVNFAAPTVRVGPSPRVGYAAADELSAILAGISAAENSVRTYAAIKLAQPDADISGMSGALANLDELNEALSHVATRISAEARRRTADQAATERAADKAVPHTANVDVVEAAPARSRKSKSDVTNGAGIISTPIPPEFTKPAH